MNSFKGWYWSERVKYLQFDTFINDNYEWVCLYLQTTVKDFAYQSATILQEAMKWAPQTVRSHLMEYLLEMENTSQGLFQHSGLALATESVLNYAGYNRSAAALGVGLVCMLHLYMAMHWKELVTAVSWCTVLCRYTFRKCNFDVSILDFQT